VFCRCGSRLGFWRYCVVVKVVLTDHDNYIVYHNITIIAIYPYVLIPTTYQPREASAVVLADITASGLVVAAMQVVRVLTVQGIREVGVLIRGVGVLTREVGVVSSYERLVSS